MRVVGVNLSESDTHDERRQKLARIILDSMYQFLGLLDIDGNVIEINSAALEGAGVRLEDLVGKPFWDARWWAISEETRQRVRDMVQEARCGKFVRCDIEIFGEAKGHETIIVDFSLTPIFDDEGNLAFLLPEGRNVSEKVAIEAELTRRNNEVRSALDKLRQIDGFKTRFFANLSHELRTPLTLILGPVSQLLQGAGEWPDRDQQRLQTIKRNAHSLLQQVNNLLDLARIDAGEMPLGYVCADVAALVRGVAGGFMEAAEERGINLILPQREELYVDIDRSKFARVITNLIANAFKFTPNGGRIRCSIERLENERFLVSIQDNGTGVPDKLKRVIFDRFAQGANELSDKGSGLGLNIVKEFVELHHGTITVLDAPDRGAIFQIEMPVRAPEGAFVRTDDIRTGLVPEIERITYQTPFSLTTQHSAGKPRILVIEDYSDLRQFLFDVLSDDYHVILAENGAIGLSIALNYPPDLIITDLMMPELDGEKFIREMRQRGGSNVPILVLSARADEASRETLLDQFVQDYMTKPFSPHELRARVRNLITVKRTVDILQKELNSQASDINELTSSLIVSHKSLQEGLFALQISERRWQGFYENTAVGIALADAEGSIMRANPALQRMLGFSPEEIVGISLIELTEASERESTRRNVGDLLEGRHDSYQLQKRYERKDGGYLWANVSASIIPLVDNEGPRVAVLVQDVTAQLEAEDALAKAQADLAQVSKVTTMGELVASIAHEVNQPLSAIVTNSHAAIRWMEREQPDYQEVVAALGRVHRDAVHAAGVIARIRDFLKKRGRNHVTVDLHGMVDCLVQMIHRRLTEAKVAVRIEISEQLPLVKADQVQLQQVVLNLLVNSIDALFTQRRKDAEIALTVCQRSDKDILFTVSDNGPGIPPDKQPMIFEAFFSSKSDGLGMGLAISKTIVESHGGSLWLASSNPDGTCFAFTIPVENQ